MKKLILSLMLFSSFAAFANSDSCIHKFGPNTYRPKLVCDAVVGASMNVYRPIGWVQEDRLISAKLCIYDEQFFGVMNSDKKTLKNRDKAVTVKLITELGMGNRSQTYEDINLLGAYDDYLSNGGKSNLVLIGNSWQNLDSDDTIEINIDNRKNEVTYFMGLNSYLSFSGFKYKAHMKMKFKDCVYY
jgi:hypothetical protein